MEFDKNQNNISGIHNCYDRWCERCAFTNRCAIYDGSHDESKEVFIEKLGSIFANVKQDLEKLMVGWGIPSPMQQALDLMK